MALGNPQAYRALAVDAAARLGSTAPSMVAAVLAHWTCEQPGGTWPPVHNNPGFVTAPAMRSHGLTTGWTVATRPPGVGLLCVFPTPQAGAIAYARFLLTGKRYATAVARARAGDGHGFLEAVTRAGYGSQTACVLSAYARLYPGPKPPPKPPPGKPGPDSPRPASAAGLAVLWGFVDPDRRLDARPSSSRKGYNFSAWVGPRILLRVASGRTYTFARILSGSHQGAYVHPTDAGVALHGL